MRIVQKKDYLSGELTEGVVKDVLTSKRFHPRGHKVRLTDGIIGRVQEFPDQDISKTNQSSIEEAAAPNNYIPREDDLV